MTWAATHGGQRATRICLCIVVICAGLALRRFGAGFGWSTGSVKYGGSVLWGTMVFFVVAILAARKPLGNVVAFAGAVAISVELLRLVHAPWLDAFRLTQPGALLLGRVFSPWNILAYLTGIFLGLAIDKLAPWLGRRFIRAWPHESGAS